MDHSGGCCIWVYVCSGAGDDWGKKPMIKAIIVALLSLAGALGGTFGGILVSYKTATNWSTYAVQFRAIADYPEITGG